MSPALERDPESARPGGQVQTPDGDWVVHPNDKRRTEITARDKRQYGTVAYALRAILAVQQDAFVDGTKLVPLDPEIPTNPEHVKDFRRAFGLN